MDRYCCSENVPYFANANTSIDKTYLKQERSSQNHKRKYLLALEKGCENTGML